MDKLVNLSNLELVLQNNKIENLKLLDKIDKLVNLGELKLSLENNLIWSVEFDMDNLVNLSYLELQLQNNYIDNIRFEELLENLKLLDCEEILVNVVLNNIVDID